MSEAESVKRLGLKELVECLAVQLVDHPEAIHVTAVVADQMTVLELKVDKRDVGKVIGRGGRLADAMRTILHSAATRERRRVVLEIVDFA